MTSIIGTTKYLVSRLIDGNILLKSCKRYLFKDPKLGEHSVDIEALRPGSDFQDFTIHRLYRTVFLRDKFIILSDNGIF